MPLRIMRAVVKDSLVLARMNHCLIRDEKHRNPMTVPQLSRRMKKWLENEYAAHLFLNEGRVVGYCLYTKMSDFIYVRQFYVEANSRRLGLGKKAFGLMKKVAWRGKSRLRLDVLVTNRRAIAFWKAVGFKNYCLTMEAEK
jgi:ribosomal protein S18 acetylase RimI-like enzyme